MPCVWKGKAVGFGSILCNTGLKTEENTFHGVCWCQVKCPTAAGRGSARGTGVKLCSGEHTYFGSHTKHCQVVPDLKIGNASVTPAGVTYTLFETNLPAMRDGCTQLTCFRSLMMPVLDLWGFQWDTGDFAALTLTIAGMFSSPGS